MPSVVDRSPTPETLSPSYPCLVAVVGLLTQGLCSGCQA